jgi:hypothetical protein
VLLIATAIVGLAAAGGSAAGAALGRSMRLAEGVLDGFAGVAARRVSSDAPASRSTERPSA